MRTFAQNRALIMWTTLFLVFALTIVASFIQRVTGFGFGIFVMMFFPHFLPTYGECTTLSGLLAGSLRNNIYNQHLTELVYNHKF